MGVVTGFPCLHMFARFLCFFSLFFLCMKYYECICYNVWYLAIINGLHKLMVNTKIHAPSMYTSYYAHLRSRHTYAPCTLCTPYSLCTGTVHPWSNHKTPLAYSARTTRCLILTLDGCTCSTLRHGLSEVCVVHIVCAPCMCFRSCALAGGWAIKEEN